MAKKIGAIHRRTRRPVSSDPVTDYLNAPIPGVLTSSLAREPRVVRYRVRKSGPPKARLRTTSGIRSDAMTSPDGAITQMPPEPTQNTRPLVSTFIPSGTPGAAEDISQNTRLLLRVPSGATSNARMRRCGQTSPRSASWKQRSSSRLIATYRTDSSGENASPLGYSHRWWPGARGPSGRCETRRKNRSPAALLECAARGR